MLQGHGKILRRILKFQDLGKALAQSSAPQRGVQHE
jgi:hypothetical protein